MTFGILEIIKYTLFCCTFVDSVGTLQLKAWATLFALLEASVYFQIVQKYNDRYNHLIRSCQ